MASLFNSAEDFVEGKHIRGRITPIAISGFDFMRKFTQDRELYRFDFAVEDSKWVVFLKQEDFEERIIYHSLSHYLPGC